MNISTAQIKKCLKRKGGTAKRIQNLWIEVGTGNPKEIHFRFYWKQSGRRHYRHIASFGADAKPKQVKMADEKYQTMYANLRMGITPLDEEASERRAREEIEAELAHMHDVHPPLDWLDRYLTENNLKLVDNEGNGGKQHH